MQITRYMGFGGFTDFLARGLSLTKASLFDDRWEGLVKYSHLEKFTPDWKTENEWSYVSCWHAATEECDAMWRLYGRSDTAVAIETSTEKLEEALRKMELKTLVYMSTVSYRIPGETRPSGVSVKRISGSEEQGRKWSDGLFTKHTAFGFEKEYRVVVVEPDVVDINDLTQLPATNLKKGIVVDNTRDGLFLDKITVSPSACDAFIKVMHNLLRSHGCKANLVKSKLAF